MSNGDPRDRFFYPTLPLMINSYYLFHCFGFWPLCRCDTLSLLSTTSPTKTRISSTNHLPGRVAQSVTCLTTYASLHADPGVASSIPARSHTFVEIDHEIISTVILLPSAESFKKGCCQLQAKVCAPSTG